jgi:hypothetical protein
MDAGDLELLRIFIGTTNDLSRQIATLQLWTAGTVIAVLLAIIGALTMSVRSNGNGRRGA